MKLLFETFAKNQTNNQLSAPYFDSSKNLKLHANNQATLSNHQAASNLGGNRVYRQIDDFFE